MEQDIRTQTTEANKKRRIVSVMFVAFCFALSAIPGLHMWQVYSDTFIQPSARPAEQLEGYAFYVEIFNVPFGLIMFGIVWLALGLYWKCYESPSTFAWALVIATSPIIVQLSVPDSGIAFMPLNFWLSDHHISTSPLGDEVITVIGLLIMMPALEWLVYKLGQLTFS